MNKTIKLFSPTFDHKEINAAIRTLNSSNWASGAGIWNVSKFEESFRKYVGAKECIAVDSGTAALHLALNLLDIHGSEILVPSLTFVSTVHSILQNGGTPIFVDVDPNTACIDPHDIKRKISKKTKAIIPVHFGGFPCEMKEIGKIAKKKSIHVIDDAAHACGSTYQGNKIGSINELTCFSFHPVKNLAMPKGGAITLNTSDSPHLKKRLSSLRWCGIDKRNGPFYDVSSLGFNYYMDEISASIGIEQLKKLDKLNRHRLRTAKKYHDELDVSEKMPFNKDCSYHFYWIRVKNRAQFMKSMLAKKIETGSHYRPVHLMSFYNSEIPLPVTEKFGKEIVTIPTHPNLTEEDIEYVIKSINSLVNTSNPI